MFKKDDVLSILIVDMLDKNRIVPRTVTINRVHCDSNFNIFYDYCYFNEKILFHETQKESNLIIL